MQGSIEEGKSRALPRAFERTPFRELRPAFDVTGGERAKRSRGLGGVRFARWRFSSAVNQAENELSVTMATAYADMACRSSRTVAPSALRPYSSTCMPSSTTRSGGILKNAFARRALRAISTNSRSRHSGSPGRRVARSVSTPRKNVVSARSIGKPLRGDFTQRLGHVRLLHEAVAQRQTIEALSKRLDFSAVVRRHVRHIIGHDGQQDHTLVKHLVVLKVVQQGRRRALQVAGHENRRARHALRWKRLDVLQESIERIQAFAHALGEQRAAALPGRKHGVDDRADDEREPAAVRDLRQVGAKEAKLDEKEEQRHRSRHRAAHAPRATRHQVRQHRRDQHRERDGHAVGGGEGARRAEAHHETERGEHQRPVHLRDVDLPLVVRRGVLDVETRASIRAGSPGA